MRDSDETVFFLAHRLAASQAIASFCAYLLDATTNGSSGLAAMLSDLPWADTPWQPTDAHWRAAQRQALALRMLDITLVRVDALPARLLQARPHAPCLFVRGDPALLHAPAIGLVGSRRASATAVQWAHAYAAEQAHSGQLVISGGALGIDAAAHEGALQAGGRTLAYVGSAVDHIYPAQNRHLFQRILSRGGAIVSEHPPGATTQAWHHAARNRFIAAHAHTLVVAEAAEKSGTLGTARWAHRLKRAIVVPPEGVSSQRGGIDMLLHKGMAQVAALP